MFFIRETKRVYCAVRTDCQNSVQSSFVLLAVQWLRLLVSRLSPPEAWERSWEPLGARLELDKLAVGQTCLRVLSAFFLSVSSHGFFSVVFVCRLLLPGQTGENWWLSKKEKTPCLEIGEENTFACLFYMGLVRYRRYLACDSCRYISVNGAKCLRRALVRSCFSWHDIHTDAKHQAPDLKH